MVRAAYQILKERSDSGKIDTEVMGKIGVIANSLVNRNFAAANAVQMVRK